MESFEDSETSEDMYGLLLIFKKNGVEGATYSLPKGQTTIGASKNADIRIKLEDTEDIHCAIKVNEDGIATIINKANKHPVIVNNSIVNRARILRNKDFIEVASKKFQYKNDILTDQDIDTAMQKLLSRSNKASILKKKSAIPRSVTERKPIITTKVQPSSAASKRRLSLQVSHQNKLQSRNEKTGIQIPRINVRRSSLNYGDCFRNSSRKSIRQSRCKIASDESEQLRISSYSTCSPLKDLSTSEADSENEVFGNQVQDNPSADCDIGDMASVEYLLMPTRISNISQTTDVSSTRISSVGRNLQKTSQMLSVEQENDDYLSPTMSEFVKRSIGTRKSVNTKETRNEDYNDSENVRTRLSSARKSAPNRSQIQTPGTRRSIKSQSTVGPDNSTNDATPSEDSDECETEENGSLSRLSSARKSAPNRSQIQTPGSRRSIKRQSTVGPDNSTNNATPSKDSDECETEENGSLSRLSSERKSTQNRSQIQTTGSRRSIKRQSTVGPDNSTNDATPSEDSDECETEENVSLPRLSSARKSAPNRSQIQTPGTRRSIKRQYTVGPDNSTNDATPSEDSDECETEENVSLPRLSSARKSAPSRSQIQTPGTRRSIKRQSTVVPDNSTNNATPSEDSDECETEENVSLPRLSSARKSTQNRSQIQTPGSRRSIKRQSTVVPDNSTNDATPSEDSDECETEENVSLPRLSSARKSAPNRSQIQTPGTRRSIKRQSTVGPDNSTNDATPSEDSDECETEENMSPKILSPARKSAQYQTPGSRRSSKNLTTPAPVYTTSNTKQSDNTDESETEENVSRTRLSSARKSTQNRSQFQATGSRRSAKNRFAAGADSSMDDATQSNNSDECETEENVSLPRLSSPRKSTQNRSQIQTPGSRRSIKSKSTVGPDNSTNDAAPSEDSDECETEENVSRLRLSSARKNTQNLSQIQTPGSRRSSKNLTTPAPIYTTSNTTQSENTDESESEENVSRTRLSSIRKSTQNISHQNSESRSVENLSVAGTDNSTNNATESGDSDESEENVSPTISWSARKSAQNKTQIQTPDSRRSVKNQLSSIDSVSPIRMSTNVEISVDTPVHNDTISTRASSSKKSLQRRSNIQTPHTKRSMANQSIDLSRSLFEQNLSPSKMSSVRKSRGNVSSNRNNRTSKLVNFDANSSDVDDGNVNTRNRKLVELNPEDTSNSKIAELEKTIDLSNLEANSIKRSSRKRKSTINDDFFYGSFSIKSYNEDVVTVNKFDSTTIPLETSVDNVSALTKDDELSIKKALTDNETCSTSYRDSSVVIGKSTVNISLIDLTTPKSPVGRRKKSLPYQPITEDITPGTPVGSTELEEGFKTPLNTPHLFKSIRKSVLLSRQQRNSDKLVNKATKRARESTSSTSRSNKRIKLTINEDDTYEEQAYSFASFTSDDIFEEDDPHEIVAGTPQHIVELTEKPVVTYPTTKFSTDIQQKKGGAVRRSLPSTDHIIPKATRRSLQINTFTSEDVGRTISTPRKLQKEPENDLTDVEGVKRLFTTPKIQNPPKNDLTNIPPIKKLLATPRNVKSPKNDLTKIPNLRKIMSPKQQNTPNNDLTDIRGVRKLMRTPVAQKQPRNDLSDVEGVSNMFNASVHHRLSNASDIENNEDLFNKIFDKKSLKTYRSKSTSPLKQFDAYGGVRKSVGDVPMINPRVSMWINEQKELQKKVVEKTGRKVGKKGVDNVQCPTVSSTRRRIYNDGDKVRTNSETTDNTEDSDIKTRKKKVVYKEDSPKPVRGRRNAIKQLKEIEDKATKEDSPKPVRGRRNAIKKLEEIDDTPTTNSPKPARGRRKATKKLEEIEDIVTDSPKPVRGRRNAIKKLEEIEDSVTDSPKPVRGRRNAMKKLEEIEDTETTESPKPARGRRKAMKKLEEIEDSVTDSPKPVRGRRNAMKKLEEIEDTETTESPKPARGRRKAMKKLEEIEDSVKDSPKPVRGRRNASKNEEIEDKVVLDSPKPVRGRRNAIKKIEEIEDKMVLDSPKSVRGRRNASKNEEIEDGVTDSPKPVAARRNAVKNKEMNTENIQDLPKASTRGRRKKNAVESENMVDSNNTKEESEKYVELKTKDSPVIARGRRNKKKVETVEEFEENAVTRENEKKTTENSQVDTPTESETEIVRRGRKKAVNLKKRKTDVESNEDIEESDGEVKNKRVKVLKKIEEVVEASSPSTKTTRSRRNADVNEKEEKSIEPAEKTGRKKVVKQPTRGKKVDSDVSESSEVSVKRSTRQKKVQFNV